MKSGIVADGELRLRRGQKKLSTEAIEKRFAKEIAAAQPPEKEQIYQRMAAELSRQINHKPSPCTLW